MNNVWQRYFMTGILALAIGSTGCVAMEMEMGLDEMDMDESIGSIGQAYTIENGLWPNGLPRNGLPRNGLPRNGLPRNGLPRNGLPRNGLPSSSIDTDWNSWLTDTTEDSGTQRKVLNFVLMKYIVRCALPANKTSTYRDTALNDYSWGGEIGVAPEWETGEILESKERWISSCVASLVNANADSVIVSQRGVQGSPMDTMVAGEEDSYTEPEGAYFGNVFTDPPVLYACKDSTYLSELNSGRRCTLGSGNCPPIQHLGDCSSICSSTNRTVGSETFAVYHSCDPDGAGGEDPYQEVTTVFLNPVN